MKAQNLLKLLYKGAAIPADRKITGLKMVSASEDCNNDCDCNCGCGGGGNCDP